MLACEAVLPLTRCSVIAVVAELVSVTRTRRYSRLSLAYHLDDVFLCSEIVKLEGDARDET